MVTNKYKKNVRRLFVLFVVSIVCFFAFFYQSMQQVYSSKVYYFINNLRIMYPEVDVPSALLSNILQFQITPLMWLLGFIAVALLILMYYYIHSFHKAYSKDINRIIDQMDEEDFIPSSLEGELSLLEDKIYAYKLGPVIESVYEKYKKSGHDFVEDDKKTEDETKKKLPIRSRIIASEEGLKKILSIDKTLEKYGKYSASQLVDITHKESSPWTKAGAGTSQYQEISDDLILQFHKYESI